MRRMFELVSIAKRSAAQLLCKARFRRHRFNQTVGPFVHETKVSVIMSPQIKFPQY